MSAPSEPEKYSVDEMMERLKNRHADEVPEDGELVIRADGSQAIRVRKRKRRSQQPHKEKWKHSRRSRMIQVAAVLILLLLAAGAAGFAVVFANSSLFRQQLLQQITQSSGARASIEQFRMNPTSAYAQRLVLTWPEGNALKNLTLNNLKANIDLSSFFGQSMTGDELSASEGTLILQTPRPDQASRETASPGDSLPVSFKRYAVQKAEMLIGDPKNPLLHLRNSDSSFYQTNGSDHAQLLLNCGDLTIVGCPKLRIDRAHIEFRASEIDIIGMRLQHETDNRGLFELMGTVSPYAADSASTLAIRLESYLLSGITGPSLGRLISGRVDTVPDSASNSLSFTSGPNPQTALSLTFCKSITSPFELNGFPFLFGLSQTLGDTWFERPVFKSEVHGMLHRTNEKITLSRLNIQQKGRLALRGTLTLDSHQNLSGTLEIGLADVVIQSANTRRLNAMFGPPSDDFRWLTLKIEGSASAPTDNFRKLFETVATEKPPLPSSEIPTFEELTKPK